jgi:hypothetical protein
MKEHLRISKEFLCYLGHVVVGFFLLWCEVRGVDRWETFRDFGVWFSIDTVIPLVDQILLQDCRLQK